MKLTTYPMYHIGARDYYERISGELERCRFVLVEGVDWRQDGRSRPLYDLVARNLDLVTQRQELIYPEMAERINIDMPRETFRRRFLRIPIRYQLLLRFLRPILWLLTVVPKMRRMFLVRLVERDAGEFRSNRSMNPLSRLIGESRDKVIVKNLRAFYERHGDQPSRVWAAIVFGAGHMPAIEHCLRELGFRPGTKRWFTVFSIDGSIA